MDSNGVGISMNIETQRQQNNGDLNNKYKMQILKLLAKNQTKLPSNLKIDTQNNKLEENQFQERSGNTFDFQHEQFNETKTPTQDQLCDILSLIKQMNKKTSIQLIIKIIHQIVCFNQSAFSKNIKNHSSPKKFQRFEKYFQRLKQYTSKIKTNYLLHSKTESKIESNFTAIQSKSSITQLSNKKFLQFSSPFHVIQYFKYQLTSEISLKQIQKENFTERLQEFNLFKLKGHASENYDNDRKTAKIFCLVGPGVRPARQFLGDQLGPSSHCKTVSHVVKIAYRQLETYINQNLYHFTVENQKENENNLSHNQKGSKIRQKLPYYFASRRELSTLKTPLFNCRNWMNDEELELFFMFVKKAYRIIYNKEWLISKRRQIFILFGRILKKLLQREILIRNLQVLKDNGRLQLTDGQKYFGISTDQGLIKLTRKQMISIQKRNQKKSSQKIKLQGGQKQKSFSKEQLFKKKYQRLALSFRSDL